MRISLDDVCMATVAAWEGRSTCSFFQVAAFIINPFTSDPLTIGYNGAPRGMPHCTDVEPVIDGRHHVNCLHAEDNALGRIGYGAAAGMTVYCSLTPCRRCTIKCIQANIGEFVFRETYANKNGGVNEDLEYTIGLFLQAGIGLRQWKQDSNSVILTPTRSSTSSSSIRTAM